jgi:nitric oxide reductase large subunit
MLAIGLDALFPPRARSRCRMEEGLVKFSFRATNIGLMLMVMLSLLPVGLMQRPGRRLKPATGSRAALNSADGCD